MLFRSDDGLREVWAKRLARVSGTIGVIKVGGATEVEVKERKDRVDDAIRAVRAAIEEGIVAGGGVALIRCANALEKVDLDNNSMNEGVRIVINTLIAPLKKMLQNADLPLSILTKVEFGECNFGYNIKNGQYGDMIKQGVIDPAKVIRCALQNAASVANSIITTECEITMNN